MQKNFDFWRENSKIIFEYVPIQAELFINPISNPVCVIGRFKGGR